MKLTLIAAKAKNNVIGKENDLIWRLPADFKRFKAITSGHYILMGRKTFLSLGKPLPDRTHLVITRDPKFEVPEGHFTFGTIEDAFTFCNKLGVNELFIIGGGEIYSQTIAMADKLILTEVEAEPEGDTYFPEFDPKDWKEVFREYHPVDSRHRFAFSFVDYEKIDRP
ncbi:dihydrofolate reductase [Algoriphagus sp. NF]|mgnify:CR=1 FL=1|jgi:dihydrofolate reductase|uniref:dihydrofolate reductase n=1 Tax=Algoriphagus TaxID=246875 RepID=UPI0004056D9B|nr:MULTISPECIES: dihydrofolate reductase [Algoriphagus]MCR9082106.1 dihydrofolate reductase [Cyclobacteriaceae bacterium]MDE0561055.1 dihydrofolate reductase [Algoriphagus sp. NF]